MREPDRYRWRDENSAKRMSDGLAFHHTILTPEEIFRGRWVIVRLSDGWVDPTVYESHAEAMKYAPGLESLYAYFRVVPERLSPTVCDVLLMYVRRAYENGYRPSPGVALILPTEFS